MNEKVEGLVQASVGWFMLADVIAGDFHRLAGVRLSAWVFCMTRALRLQKRANAAQLELEQCGWCAS